MTVIFLSYATHLSDEYFDEPLTFKPERYDSVLWRYLATQYCGS